MSRVDSADGAALRLVAGLGNPGARFVGTRHNIGFRVVGELASRRSTRFEREECNSLVGAADGLLVVKPLTFMNRSGYALRCLLERHDIRPTDVLVIYDEVHLPLGRLRLRRGGEPAGHRGMESIVRNLQTTDVPRLRLGVGPQEGRVTQRGDVRLRAVRVCRGRGEVGRRDGGSRRGCGGSLARRRSRPGDESVQPTGRRVELIGAVLQVSLLLNWRE